jgi:hypothetical protein
MTPEFIISSLIPTIAIIVVGVILRKQIKSQQEILEMYKGYASTFDSKKYKEAYEDVHIPMAVSKALKKFEENWEKENEDFAIIGRAFVDQYDEMQQYIGKQFEGYDKQTVDRIVNDNFPKSQRYLLTSLASRLRQKNDPPKTD